MNCKRLLALVFVLSLCMSLMMGTTFASADSAASGIRPDTWVAVDGLGRTVSSYGDVGDTRENKTVALFFHNWHDYWSGNPPRNISQIISQYPEAKNDFNHPAWEGTGDGALYFWNEPIWGYYRTSDKYVLRKQAELLADAGVDVIFLDLTNGNEIFKTGYRAIFKEFQAAKADGVDAPKISFFLNPYLNSTDEAYQLEQITNIYEDIYKDGDYQDMWFYWEGKPMIMARQSILKLSDATQNAIRNFFTFRDVDMNYYADEWSISEKKWGWCSVYPQGKFGVREDGSVEMMCVSAAQNADKTFTDITHTIYDMEKALVSMNDPQNRAQGRGYAKGDYSYQYTYANQTLTINQETKDAYLYGLNFQQQWDYALSVDPDLIFVTGWNELNAQRRLEWQGAEGGFPDNFNDEFSRDIEPSKGVLKDNFYYQLVDNIRKFKGVGKPEAASADKNVGKTVDINSKEDQWADVKLSFDHYTGSTQERKYPGYSGKVYKYDTMRNDIVTSKVAYDEDYIYFMVETKEDLTSSSDTAWMRLLLDTDPTGVTANWEGFEYIINRTSPTEDEVVIEKSTGGWNFSEAGTAKFSVSGKRLQIAVPRSALGLTDSSALSFNFKWADNTVDPETKKDTGDIMDYYLYGDVAPGGRFMFSFNTEGVSYDSKPTTAPDGAASSQSGLPAYVWWIVGAGAALVVAMGVVMVVVLKKKPN